MSLRITSFSQAFDCYLKPTTQNEKLAFCTLFAIGILSGAKVAASIAASPLIITIGAVTGASLSLITIVAYRVLIQNNNNFEKEQKNEPKKIYKSSDRIIDSEIKTPIKVVPEKPVQKPLTEFEKTLELANKNDQNAQFALGNMYVKGKEVEKDDVKALQYFVLSANQGNVKAQFNAGSMYQRGRGAKADLNQAIKYYKLAADQGDPKAFYSLGLIYEKEGPEKNLKLAFDYYKQAAVLEHPKAFYSLGLIYEKEGPEKNLKLAFDYYKQAAALEHPEAKALILGQAYETGDGRNKNDDLAFENYLVASDSAYAKNKLIDFCLQRRGIQKNYKGAINYFKKLISSNNPETYLYCAIIYHIGWGDGPNQREIQEALFHYKQAAKLGESQAIHTLGLIYENGQGVDRSNKKALKYYFKATGYGPSLYRLGQLYEEGIGVEQNERLAINFYYLGTTKSDVASMLALGELFEKKADDLNLLNDSISSRSARAKQNLNAKKAVEMEKALTYYNSAADLGNETAQAKVAKIYENEKKFDLAFKYHLKATIQGNDEARKALDALCKKGLGVKENYEAAFAYYTQAAEKDDPSALNLLKTVQLLKPILN